MASLIPPTPVLVSNSDFRLPRESYSHTTPTTSVNRYTCPAGDIAVRGVEVSGNREGSEKGVAPGGVDARGLERVVRDSP